MISLTNEDLTRLTGTTAQTCLRDLLWAEARRIGVPVSAVQISSDVDVADGGIDAAIIGVTPKVESELLLGKNTYFQSKAGTTFKPWQQAQLQNELFGRGNDATLENLAPMVRRCLDDDSRYLIALFGVDPNTAQHATASTTLLTLLSACGYTSPDVQILGQTQILGLISTFPSLAMSLKGISPGRLITLDNWRNDPLMQPKFTGGEKQTAFIETVRGLIGDSGIGHIRVCGEPGLGKTRLVLEALNTEEYSSLVIYSPDPSDVEGSDMLTALLAEDMKQSAILVVDDCPTDKSSSLWRLFKGRIDRLQLVTLDHDLDRLTDNGMQVLSCPKLEDVHVAEILQSYVGEGEYIPRWSALCDGSPRVAHLLGANLRDNPEDVLRPPATLATVWNRYIQGVSNPTAGTPAEFEIMARTCALFNKFGFEDPVEAEGEFVADLVTNISPAITRPKFQAIVGELQRRRVLQGRHTLRLVPRALHIHLWVEFWETYGNAFPITSLMERMPESLFSWFTQMFIYAHASARATRQVERILGAGGPFDDDDFIQTEVSTSFLSTLAEANPEAALSTIERTIGERTKEWLLNFSLHRQSIVWALEKTAYWPDLFNRSASMLLKLGATETGTNCNNASGTFASLFSLGYGRIATSASRPSDRLQTLRDTILSETKEKRLLGLKACKTALDIHRRSKMIGPEYQGLRTMPDPWMPESNEELWEAYGDVWGLLVELLPDIQPDERVAAYEVLIEAAFGLLQIQFLEHRVLSNLEGSIDDPVLPREKLAALCASRHINREDGSYSVAVQNRLSALDELIAGNTFASKYERYVVFRIWDEEITDRHDEETTVQDRIDELVNTALTNSAEFFEIARLHTGKPQSRQFDFGLTLGKIDLKGVLIQPILDSFRAGQISADLTGAYLRGIQEHDSNVWETSLLELVTDDAAKPMISDLIWASGFNTNILAGIHDRIANGEIMIASLRNIMYFGKLLTLTPEIINSHISLCLRDGSSPALAIAVDLCDQYYCSKESATALPVKPTYDVLVHPQVLSRDNQGMSGYHWGRLLQRFSKLHADEMVKLFGELFALLSNTDLSLGILYSSAGEALVDVCRDFPHVAWPELVKILDPLSKLERHKLHYFLDADHGRNNISVVTHFPQELVLNWIRENPAKNGRFIAEVCAKDFGDSPEAALTRALMIEFGSVEEVRRALHCHFCSGSSWGPRSEYCRKKREEAQGWLAAESCDHIKSWLTEYIADLTREIERNEIEEEREF